MLDHKNIFTPPRDLKKDRLQMGAVALAIGSIYLLTLVLQLALAAVVHRFFPAWIETAGFETLFSALPTYLIAMPLSLLIYRAAEAYPPRKPAKLSPLAFLGMMAVCFAVTYVGNIAGTVIAAYLERLTGLSFMPDLQNIMVKSPLWVNLLVVGIAAPVLEEIFYRKLVIDRLFTFGELPAVLISALIFGLLHGNLPQFIYASLMGLLFGYIYIRTGRLLYTVSLHMILNITSGVFIAELLKRLDPTVVAEQGEMAAMMQNLPVLWAYLLYFGFLCLCMIGALCTAVIAIPKLRIYKADTPPTKKEWVKIILLNPAVWFLVAVIVLLFIPA